MQSTGNALALLSSYGGDSSDEELPNVRASAKRSLVEPENKSAAKRSRMLLPMPPIIAGNIRGNHDAPVDDELMHGGRSRSFPHERGNWVTYVFVPYEAPHAAIAEIITRILNRFPHWKLQPIDHFHISLTKTVILRHHWIESFVQAVREKTSLIRKFVIMFDSLNIYCNEERTRTFIGLEIKTGYDTLLTLVKHMDTCLDAFRLPHFYESPSFHMSLMWCVGDHEAEIRNILPQLSLYAEEVFGNYPQNICYNYVTHLECKSGNKRFDFNLA